MPKGYQQGDVLFAQVADMPDSVVMTAPQGKDRYILVEGEHTGHVHAVHVDGVQVYVTPQGRQYLKVLDAFATIQHDSHKPQILAKGIYEISRVVEIDPYTEELRIVAD